MRTVLLKAEVGIPQERLDTFLRGHGPRRGNLERLLKYWRKRMRGRPPGSFRRCVISLADEPGVRQPPHALCAWIMKTVTGKWPCEGGRCKKHRRRGRSLLPGKQMYREIESKAYQPLNGQQSLVDYKAAVFAQIHGADDLLYRAWGIIANAGFREGEEKTSGWHEAARNWRDQYHEYLDSTTGQKDLVPNSVQTIASSLLPGETRPWRAAHPRRIGYSLLFGGLVGGPKGRGVGGRIGGNVRNPYRCPPGFEGGGKFTNRSFSTCGEQILSVPGGNVSSQTRQAIRRSINQTSNEIRNEGTQTQTDVRLAQVHQNQVGKLRGAILPDVGRPNPSKRSSSITSTMNGLEKASARDSILQRLVRRDGVVSTPLVGVDKLASLRGNDDLKGAAYLTRFNKPTGSTGIAEIGLFNAGINEVHFSLPGNIRVVASTGKKVSPRDIAAFKSRAATLAKTNTYPMGGLVALANESNLFKISASAPKVSTPNQKVRVRTEKGVVRVVPRWVFLTFLSKNAPLRGSDPVYSLVEEVGGASAEKADVTYNKFEGRVQAFYARVN